MDKRGLLARVYSYLMDETAVSNAFVALRLCEKNFRAFLSARTKEPMREEEGLVQDFRFLVHCLAGGTMKELDVTSLRFLTFLNEVVPCESFYKHFVGNQGPYPLEMPQYLHMNKEEYFKGLETAMEYWTYEIGPEFFKAFIQEEPPIRIKPYPFGNAVAKLHNELLNAMRMCNKAFLEEDTYFQFLEQIRLFFRPPYTAAVEDTPE